MRSSIFTQPPSAIERFAAIPHRIRGTALEKSLALLKSWGMGGLDVAGIEPDEADAEQQIQYYIEQAKQYDLLILGGADYRGFGTGWLKYSPWMDHPLIFGSLNQLVESAVPVAASVKIESVGKKLFP